uniref:ATP synthase complex subunit 8 n=1 Tax=Plethodon elongatus TaxID=46761 RepID=Q644R5_9SALA|nr:ATP synthase F0 subunit 8 [Plethodon elongatus]AAU20569.1 ATP synthase F0 subunit 8 [Plethodon elongatus]
MPQLNPGPWFIILFMSWLIYMTIISPKINKFKMSHQPTTQNINKDKPQPWNWPWT